MNYTITFRFNVEFDTEDINVAQELVNEMACDELLCSANSPVNVEVDCG